MTKREFFVAIMEQSGIAEELRAFAEEEITKMDERNAKRSSTPSKKSIENEPIKEQIVAYLTEVKEPKTAPEIGEVIEQTHNKVGALCRQLMDEGKVNRTEGKVKGKGKMVFWSVAPAEEAEG